MSFVDTSKTYLRQRDSRILPYGAMGAGGRMEHLCPVMALVKIVDRRTLRTAI
jgi:hypothetical protein